MNKLQVEISGRLTGKSTRLIEQMERDNQKGIHGVLVVCSPAMADLRSQQLRFDVVTCNQLRGFMERRDLKPSAKVRFYYDDFDQYVTAPPLDSNGYYATTPARVRDDLKDTKDFLSKLVTKLMREKGVLVNYTNPAYVEAMKERVKGVCRSDMVAQKEAYGKYLKGN